MNIYRYGKKIIYKYPFLSKLCSKIYNFFRMNIKTIKGKNNKIYLNNSFLNKCKISIVGSNNSINFGNLNYIQNTSIVIYGNNNKIEFGEKVFIKNGDIYFEDNENELIIKGKTIIAGKTHLALTEGKKIEIGKQCLFSSNVVIRTGDSHSIIDSDGNRINNAQNVVIADHVWITQNVTILKGSMIGKNSVVATGSVVNKKINEANVIIAGNPATIKKYNINWKQDRI